MKKICIYAALFLLILCGCSKAEEKAPKPKDRITQYYKKHEITLPKYTSNIKTIWVENAEVKAILSTSDPYMVYTWNPEKEQFEKTSDLSFPPSIGFVRDLFPLHNDRYLLHYDNDKSQTLYVLLDGEKQIPLLFGKEEGTDMYLQAVTPLEDGFLAESGNDNSIYYFTYDGNLVRQFPLPDPSVQTVMNMTVMNDTLYLVTFDSILAYSISDGKQLEFADDSLKKFLSQDALSLVHYQKESDQVFKVCPSGIYSYSRKDHTKNHLLKQHLDLNNVDTFYGSRISTITRDNDLFVALDDYQKCKLYWFEYIPEGYRSDTEPLTVHSLYTNMIPEELLVDFEKKYPQYYVETTSEFKTLPEKETDIQSAFERIEKRLSSKKAPDLLLCDGLPTDSYIQADFLEPLNDYMPKGSADWFFNVLHTYMKEKKVYALPSDFSIPVLTGTEETLNAGKDLKTFTEYLKTQSAGNPSMFYHMDFEVFWETLYGTYIPGCFSKDGSIDQDMLKTFFQCADILQSGIIPAPKAETAQWNAIFSSALWKPSSYKLSGNLNELLIHDATMTLGNLASPETLSYLKGLKETQNLSSEIFAPETVSYYVPSSIIALPKHSSHKEGAKKFVEFFFNKRTNYFGALPVSFQRLQNVALSYDDIDAASVSTIGEDNITKQVPFSKITKEELMTLFKKIVICKYGGHDDAFTQAVIMNAYYQYHNKQLTLDEAVTSVIEKLSNEK